MPATIVVDALWGDSGKGKIAAYIAQKHHAAFAVRAGTGTNAGHSIHFENGESIRTHQLPCGWLDPKTQLRIGSGVAVDPICFFDEIECYGLMVVKAMPTRVGEGPLPHELSVSEIEKRGMTEYGVTTGRLRRKAAHIPWELFEEAVMLNGPTQIALTFCDHFDPDIKGIRNVNMLTDPIRNLIREVENRAQIPVTLVETGKHFEDIIDLSA